MVCLWDGRTGTMLGTLYAFKALEFLQRGTNESRLPTWPPSKYSFTGLFFGVQP